MMMTSMETVTLNKFDCKTITHKAEIKQLTLVEITIIMCFLLTLKMQFAFAHSIHTYI